MIATKRRAAQVGTGRRLVKLVSVLILASLAAAGAAPVGAAGATVRIVALGDSLMVGLDLKPSEAFPAQLEKVLTQRGHKVVVDNAGVSGDTTAAGLGRVAWAVPDGTDAVILEFGANDALRGIDPKETRANLDKMISQLKAQKVEILFAGMLAPANWGDAYQKQFDAIFPELAKAHGLQFYPFFLDGVALQRKLTQADGLHPTGEGIAEVVKRILPEVEQLIGKIEAKRAATAKP